MRVEASTLRNKGQVLAIFRKDLENAAERRERHVMGKPLLGSFGRDLLGVVLNVF